MFFVALQFQANLIFMRVSMYVYFCCFTFSSFRFQQYPRKLTWNLDIACLKRKHIFQTFIFGFHVNLQQSSTPFFFKHYSYQCIFPPGRSQQIVLHAVCSIGIQDKARTYPEKMASCKVGKLRADRSFHGVKS